jgi:hypothetical protein
MSRADLNTFKSLVPVIEVNKLHSFLSHMQSHIQGEIRREEEEEGGDVEVTSSHR